MSDPNQPPPLPPHGAQGHNPPPLPHSPGSVQNPHGQFGAPNQQGAPGVGANVPYGQPPKTDKKNKRWLIIVGVAVVAIAGLLVAAIAGGWFGGNKTTDAKPDEKTSATEDVKASGAEPDSATYAMEAWAAALAAGDLDELDKWSSDAFSGPLVSDEVVKASLKLKPIEDINVIVDNDDSMSDTTGSVSYQIGDEKVTLDVTAKKVNESFLVGYSYRVVSPLDEDVPTSVNGVEIDDPSEAFYMLPIYYDFAATSKYVTATATTTTRGVGTVDPFVLEFEYTPDASEAALAAVKEQVDVCLAEKTLESTCSWTLENEMSDGQIDEGSVTRTLTADGQSTLDSMKFTPGSVELVLEGEGLFPDYAATCVKKDGTTGECKFNFKPRSKPIVDLTGEEPIVTWGPA